MAIHFLTRRRMVLDQQVQEPTLLAMALTVIGFAVLLGVCVVAIAGLPALGYLEWSCGAKAGRQGNRRLRIKARLRARISAVVRLFC